MDEHLRAGINLLQLNRYAEAVAHYDRMLALDPANVDALVNQAFALNRLQRYEAAIAACDRALTLRPDDKTAAVNGAVALGFLERHALALEYLDRALAFAPRDSGALNNRALTLLKLRRFEDALAGFAEALASAPDSPEILTNIGYTQCKLGRYGEAMSSYGRALEIQADFGDAIWNETLCNLMLGRFTISPEKLEWLWTKGFLGRQAPGFSCPVWTGRQGLGGKAILLHEDQGLGDAILSARYVSQLVRKGAAVYFGLVPQVRPLMERIEGVTRVLTSSVPDPAIDFQCPISSLPFAFGTTRSTIPAPIPYLSMDQAAVAAWRSKLAASGEKLVAICWRGSPNYIDDADRSIGFSRIASILAVAGIRFVSLQKELTEAECSLAKALPGFVHPGAELLATAEIVAACDLVISVDSAWAHCAGAMGRPVWVLLPLVPYWVWFVDGEKSPWYPSARLFRQSEIGDWDGLARKVAQALAGWRDS